MASSHSQVLSQLPLLSLTQSLTLSWNRLSSPVSKMKLLLVKANHLSVSQVLAMVALTQVKKTPGRREMHLGMNTLPPVALPLMSLLSLSPFSETTVNMRKMVPTASMLRLPMASSLLSQVMMMVTNRE